MTITDAPWRPPATSTALRLEQIQPALIDALATGAVLDDLTGSEAITPYLAGPECAGLWRMRSAQLAHTPADAPWVTRFILVDGETAAVGLAGFHGQPDENGMVEIGYRVDPAQRRRGYARIALETLLAAAADDARVRTVRATISPENHASRALIDQYGFVAVGEQWDEEDGLEIVLEVAA
ncbi:GNAT family N-acetyltransferase [Agromyces subbeticus]|uniref:GNAT family N-acetyltransferase n=1 Tax=Agromyces subbeticus TaxID=293890 RepID=UPI0003F7E89C|nr:GNAT family N-acetyltransferase [Agromyces subbeticus]